MERLNNRIRSQVDVLQILPAFFLFRTLRPGDQLAVAGEKNGIEYYHHGIFISHEEGIIHFGGENKADAQVR